MAQFTIRQGTTVPFITARLEDAEGNAIDLTNATIEFVMADQMTDTVFVQGPAQILNTNPADVPPDGFNVQYAWAADDTVVPGIYRAEWRVTRAGGTYPETFPSVGAMIVSITRAIGGG